MSAPVCRLCGSDLDPGSDLTRHILVESCVKAHGERLERLEQGLADLLARKEHATSTQPGGERVSERALERGTCADCGGPFPKRCKWAKFCGATCRSRGRSNPKQVEP